MVKAQTSDEDPTSIHSHFAKLTYVKEPKPLILIEEFDPEHALSQSKQPERDFFSRHFISPNGTYLTIICRQRLSISTNVPRRILGEIVDYIQGFYFYPQTHCLIETLTGELIKFRNSYENEWLSRLQKTFCETFGVN